MEKFFGISGHELNINDYVEWTTSGFTLIGQIVKFDNDKAIIRTKGCRYVDEGQLELIRVKAKQEYKVNPKRLFKVTAK